MGHKKRIYLLFGLIIGGLLALFFIWNSFFSNTLDINKLNTIDNFESDFEVGSEAWGYIDKMGVFIIDTLYDEVRDFSENRAAVRQGGLWGYIDSSGKVVVEIKYKAVWKYINGRAVVQSKQGKFGVMDINGNVVIRPNQYDEISIQDSNLFMVKDNGKYGFIDGLGKLIIEPKYDHAKLTPTKYFIVEKRGLYGMVDKNNHAIIPFHFQDLNMLDSHIVIFKKQNHYGFIDLNTSSEIIPNIYESIIGFNKGIAAAKDSLSWFFINEDGSRLNNNLYDRIWLYSNRYWGVLYANTTSILEPMNLKVIGANYLQTLDYSEGSIPILIGEKWAYLDSLGKVMISPKYDIALPFKNGLARVFYNRETYFIDKEDNVVITPNYMWIDVRDFSEEKARCRVR